MGLSTKNTYKKKVIRSPNINVSRERKSNYCCLVWKWIYIKIVSGEKFYMLKVLNKKMESFLYIVKFKIQWVPHCQTCYVIWSRVVLICKNWKEAKKTCKNDILLKKTLV